jgi:nitrite reductase/ring-hydroxylating ferredoxin subunit
VSDNGALRWHDLCADDDLVVGQMTNFNIGRYSILLARVEAGVVALQNVCPHERRYLHEGTLDDGVIVCDGHQWCFDAATGRGIRPRNAKLSRYEVRVIDGRIYVGLPARRHQTAPLQTQP